MQNCTTFSARTILSCSARQEMKNGQRIFDAHTHAGEARHSGRRYSVDALLQDMDRFGVDRSLVIPFPVVEDWRAAHDEIGRATAAHPDRLAGAACLYPFIPERQFRDEVRRCRERYGFTALKLQPQYQALNPISSSSDFLFEAALENRMAVVCHTGSGVPYSLPSLFMIPARKFPDLRIVLAHSGGGLFAGEAIVAARFCPNIYLELSTLAPHQMLEIVREVPAGRLMIGSDLPESLDFELGKVLALENAEQRRRILWDTACGLFCPAAP
jgi:predicted TIM-barrel fold metal-dependent hydrolase